LPFLPGFAPRLGLLLLGKAAFDISGSGLDGAEVDGYILANGHMVETPATLQAVNIVAVHSLNYFINAFHVSYSLSVPGAFASLALLTPILYYMFPCFSFCAIIPLKEGLHMTKHYEQRKEANEKYLAKMDEIRIRMQKEGNLKETIQEHAKRRGESVNGFIIRAIIETMERDSGPRRKPFVIVEDIASIDYSK